ncbi:MAG TPA: prepilin peptidase, partial [Planctomycetota bacterium]|nr:prepilin peptidase [Planctomycetota bacterium]
MSDPRTVLAYAGVSALGLCVGSFLNVVAYRLPRECMSVAGPRSRCPRCARFIAWYDNLPVLSWLLLRARCRHCGKGIPARYPLVEAGTAALFVATAAWTLPRAAFADPLAHGADWGVAGARFLVTAALIALALIDYDWEILPDQITLGGLALAPILVFAAPSLQPTPVIDDWTIGGRVVGEVLGPRWTAVVHGLLGAAACGGFLWTVGFLGSLAFRKEAMGLGDVKM